MDILKGAVKSKTVWFGLAVAVLSWVQSIGGDIGLSPEAGTIIGAIIIGLRAITNQPLAQK